MRHKGKGRRDVKDIDRTWVHSKSHSSFLILCFSTPLPTSLLGNNYNSNSNLSSSSLFSDFSGMKALELSVLPHSSTCSLPSYQNFLWFNLQNVSYILPFFPVLTTTIWVQPNKLLPAAPSLPLSLFWVSSFPIDCRIKFKCPNKAYYDLAHSAYSTVLLCLMHILFYLKRICLF